MKVLKHEKFYSRRRIQFKILQPLQSAHLQNWSGKKKVPWSREIVYGGSMDTITGQTKRSKRRFRVNRDTFNFILNAIEDLITKEVTIQRTGIARSPTWINYVSLSTVQLMDVPIQQSVIFLGLPLLQLTKSVQRSHSCYRSSVL